jgi:kynurenine formamidase
MNCLHVMSETGTDVLAAGGRQGFADDSIAMSVHAHTHWDALSHVFRDGLMYNGRGAGEVTGKGARRNDIVPASGAMVARGVLVDLAPGGEVLDSTHEVTVDELEAALDAQGVELLPGDALLIRTGHLGRIRREGDWSSFVECDGLNPAEPGIGVSCLPWLHEQEVAALACDNYAVEVLSRGATYLPVHEIGIVQMGLLLGEMFDLDALAVACAADGRWDFLLAAGPLPIVGAVGGPVNPLALR